MLGIWIGENVLFVLEKNVFESRLKRTSSVFLIGIGLHVFPVKAFNLCSKCIKFVRSDLIYRYEYISL